MLDAEAFSLSKKVCYSHDALVERYIFRNGIGASAQHHRFKAITRA